MFLRQMRFAPSKQIKKQKCSSKGEHKIFSRAILVKQLITVIVATSTPSYDFPGAARDLLFTPQATAQSRREFTISETPVNKRIGFKEHATQISPSLSYNRLSG